MKAGVLAADAQGIGAHGLSKRLQPRRAGAHAARLAHVAREAAVFQEARQRHLFDQAARPPGLAPCLGKAGASALGTTA